MMTNTPKNRQKPSVSTSIRIDEDLPTTPTNTNHRRELDEFLFHEGTARRMWTYLGAHVEDEILADGATESRAVFRVWAPHARRVSLVGSFCDWDNGIPMTLVNRNGLYILSLPLEQVPDGSVYKYRIETPDGRVYLRADPYGRAMECPPETATRFLYPRTFEWHDEGWLTQRRERAESGRRYPFSVYEVHAGSWRRHADGTPLSYRELADELAPYAKQMGFTHVELLPIMEHPFDGSWGYQVCGYYAPTSRYGDPNDFRAFIDIMHGAGIGVILDWVPAHFPKDAHGLYRFDGEPLYEYTDPTRQENRGWGTCCFDVGRNEVKSFLISNAYYWIEEFHADGLRVDAVTSMLYRNYDRADGEWYPNRYGGMQNLESIDFFRQLNWGLREDHPDVLTIAEESTIWANITSFEGDGLGFSYKWNMGWMNDTLRYVKEDPIYRKYMHAHLAHTANYCLDERYILPISHDEVVHLKKSFLDKMPGDYWQKFAGARAFAAFMTTHPGAKLWFMGCEFGQFAEWNECRQLDWFLLDYDAHARLQHYFAALNNLYLKTPALWDEDPDDPKACYKWLDKYNADECTFVWQRISREGREVVVVINFTPVARTNSPINVPHLGRYREIFNSDDLAYGGSGVINEGVFEAAWEDGCGLPRLRLTVPPMGCSILEPVPEE